MRRNKLEYNRRLKNRGRNVILTPSHTYLPSEQQLYHMLLKSLPSWAYQTPEELMSIVNEYYSLIISSIPKHLDGFHAKTLVRLRTRLHTMTERDLLNANIQLNRILPGTMSQLPNPQETRGFFWAILGAVIIIGVAVWKSRK